MSLITLFMQFDTLVIQNLELYQPESWGPMLNVTELPFDHSVTFNIGPQFPG